MTCSRLISSGNKLVKNEEETGRVPRRTGEEFLDLGETSIMSARLSCQEKE